MGRAICHIDILLVKPAIFKVSVILATSMHEITLYAIYMHQNRFITPFLTPIWKSDPHSPPDSTTSEIASYTISQIKLFEVDILLI